MALLIVRICLYWVIRNFIYKVRNRIICIIHCSKTWMLFLLCCNEEYLPSLLPYSSQGSSLIPWTESVREVCSSSILSHDSSSRKGHGEQSKIEMLAYWLEWLSLSMESLWCLLLHRRLVSGGCHCELTLPSGKLTLAVPFESFSQ